MNELTYGEMIILSIALQHYMSGIDLSTKAGQALTEMLGKLDYQMTQLAIKASRHLPIDSGQVVN